MLCCVAMPADASMDKLIATLVKVMYAIILTDTPSLSLFSQGRATELCQ